MADELADAAVDVETVKKCEMVACDRERENVSNARRTVYLVS